MGVALSFLLIGVGTYAQAPLEHAERAAKCGVIWRELYPWSYDEGLIEFFIGEHEQAGLGPEWWYSLIYGASGAGLRADMHNGPARGMFDQHFTFIKHRRQQFSDILPEHVPWRPTALYLPKVAARAHVLEASYYHERTGRLRWALQRAVFLPAQPDGARARREQRRWHGFETRHRAVLTRRWGEICQAVAQAVPAAPPPAEDGASSPVGEPRERSVLDPPATGVQADVGQGPKPDERGP